MDKKKDLYATLGVDRDAERDAIKKAYRKLARRNHPDLNPGDDAAEARFKEISTAWEVLSDAEKRRNYDEFGEVSLEAGFDAEEARKVRDAFGARFGFRDEREARGAPDEFDFGDIDDLLGRLFSREQTGGRVLRQRGADLEAGLTLDFLDALRGGEQRLTLSRPSREAAGAGVASETVTLRIPPGVDSKGRLRVPGKGSPGVGGAPAGDLWVTLRVRPHRVFRREGKNLSLELPISAREAIQGARVEVPTLDGRATLTIPAGTHSGTRLRLAGKGVPAPTGTTPGDLLVRVQIQVPQDLDDEANSALDTLRRFEDPAIRKGLFS